MNNNNAIEIKGLSKEYDAFSLKEVSFNLPYGTIMGFIGENGAGKTSTIKALLNMIRPDGGSLKIFGMDSNIQEKAIKENLGVVFADQSFPDDLKPPEISKIMKNIYKNWDTALFKNYLNRFQLPTSKNIGALSKGMKMKLSIATALSHRPKLLILDEATSGLDPVIRNEILDVFQEFIEDETHAVLLSSHITSDLERIADYITFIQEGHILFSEQKDALLNGHGIVKCTVDQYSNLNFKGDFRVKKTNFNVQVLITNPGAFKKEYPHILVDPPSLEDIMLFYTKGEKQ